MDAVGFIQEHGFWMVATLFAWLTLGRLIRVTRERNKLTRSAQDAQYEQWAYVDSEPPVLIDGVKMWRDRTWPSDGLEGATLMRYTSHRPSSSP